MDEAGHGRIVLSSVIASKSVKALDFAQSKLPEPERYLTDPHQLTLFKLLCLYSDQCGGVMTRDALGDWLRDKPEGSLQLYGEMYDALAAVAVDGHEFRNSVHQLRELADRRATGNAVAMAMRILQQGAQLPDGSEVRGHAAAREYLMTALADAEAMGDTETAEGDVTREVNDVLAAYAAAKALRASGKPVGVQLGMPAVDHALGGGLSKGLAIVVAGTSAGKSSLCVQGAWHNAVMEGRNVLYFTTEQHRTEVRLKIVARHSRHPKFSLGKGLDVAKIRSGWLSRDEEMMLDLVLNDLRTCTDYGEIQVVQMPERCTVPALTGRAESMARRAKPDLVVADYLQLFEAARRVRDAKDHETQGGIVKTAHRWALTAFHEQGVPLMSPWQTNRDGMTALKNGGFSLDQHMASSSEAARTAAVVIALALRDEDTSAGRNVPLKLSVEKNRDGARGGRFDVTADYATCYFADRETGGDDLAETFDLDTADAQ